MIFDIITIFPKIFDSYFKESLLLRAQKNKLIKINIHDLRRWTKDKHHTVDDRPYGGGLGMVLKVEPIFKAVKALKKLEARKQKIETKVVLFTPRGKKFNQQMAYKFSKLDRLILICGRYEGIDERIAKHIADVELSIGEYDLMGGELPAMVVIETIARLIPGVLGKKELLKERITKEKGFIEYPQYTRPPKFYPKEKFRRARPEMFKSDRGKKEWRVPKVLLSGNHKKIEEWRKKYRKIIEK